MIASRPAFVTVAALSLVSACGSREPSGKPAPSASVAPPAAAPAPTPPPAPAPAPAVPPSPPPTAAAPEPAAPPAPAPPDTAWKPQPAPTPEVQRARQTAIEAARTQGILGAASLQQGGAFASLSDDDVAFGRDVDIQGGLMGGEPGEAEGGFGFDHTGYGVGGGGTGWGPIGTGHKGKLGHGSGASAVPSVSLGQPTVKGALDKAIVRRYIKRSIPRIRYCYEKQLLAQSTLQGTLIATFTIDGTGAVEASKATGVDGEVSSCVAAAIKAIEFPRPTDGEPVDVSYAFTFRPTGG